MANNDQIIGLVMAIIAVVGIFVELILLIIQPAADSSILDNLPDAQYWALARPIFLGVFGVLAIVLWIGITMFRTPPPEAWDFEDFEDEIEKETADE
jgi:hypothetical protein